MFVVCRGISARMVCRLACGLTVLLAICADAGLVPAAEPPSNFASILASKNRETLAAVEAYIDSNPEAADLNAAYRWIFQTAQKEGWETEVLSRVEEFGKHSAADAATKSLAVQVQAVGLARAGKSEQALAAFDLSIDGVSLRAANETLDFATRMATAFQTGESKQSSSDVYIRLSRKFFLNPAVRQFCENRVGKLELLEKKAPDSSVTDLGEKRVDWADCGGKLVLIDFWATNCPPCLEEFPTLKQLYAEFHKEGFDVVGISLDDSPAVVESFQEKAQLPWRLALSSSDRDATRERFKVVTIPSMFLMDGEGKIVAVDVRGEELRRVVSKRLKRRN